MAFWRSPPWRPRPPGRFLQQIGQRFETLLAQRITDPVTFCTPAMLLLALCNRETLTAFGNTAPCLQNGAPVGRRKKPFYLRGPIVP